MPRVFRAGLLLGALLVALPPLPTQARQTFDGVYTGTVTRYPQEDVRQVDSEVMVTVAGSRIEGLEDFTVDYGADFGEYVEVVLRAHQWVTFSGTIDAEGSFSAPGLSYSEFDLASCAGDSCSNVTAPAGTPAGYPVTVVGTIDGAVMTAEIVWEGNVTGTYAFEATNPAYTAPTTSTVPQTTTTFTIPDVTDPTAPGVQVVGDVVFINSPSDGVLDITDADLPEWARGTIAVSGDMYVRIGPPSTLQGGDGRAVLNGLPIARVGDVTSTGGVIVGGSDRIFVNGVPAAILGSMVVDPSQSPRVPMIGGPIVTTRGCPDPAPYDGRDVCGVGITTTASPSTAGDTRVEVTDDTIEVGDGVAIGSDPDTMEARIVIDEGSLILDRPLDYDHAAGEMVARIPQEHVAEAFGTAPVDESTPWFGIVALLVAVGLGARAMMVWRTGRSS